MFEIKFEEKAGSAGGRDPATVEEDVKFLIRPAHSHISVTSCNFSTCARPVRKRHLFSSGVRNRHAEGTSRTSGRYL